MQDEIVFDNLIVIVKQLQPIIQDAFDATAAHLYKNIPFTVEYEYGRTWAAKSIEAEQIELDEEGA